MNIQFVVKFMLRPDIIGEVRMTPFTLLLLTVLFQILGLLTLNNRPTDNVVFFIKINTLCFSTRATEVCTTLGLYQDVLLD